jgi:hypothetical protein
VGNAAIRSTLKPLYIKSYFKSSTARSDESLDRIYEIIYNRVAIDADLCSRHVSLIRHTAEVPLPTLDQLSHGGRRRGRRPNVLRFEGTKHLVSIGEQLRGPGERSEP